MQQANKIRTRFDLLTSFQQGNKSFDEWYNAVQIQVTLARLPPETAKILHRDIFWFFLKEEEFVQSCIGIINYLSKFSARLSEIAEPIRMLTKDKVPFNWGQEHQSALTQMKQEIVSAPILA